MEVTKQQFEAYERVRASGITNMWDVRRVKRLSGLSQATIHEIIKRYPELMKQYPDVRKEA